MPPPAVTPLLRIVAGPSAGRSFPVVGGRATIGRGEEADLRLDDDKASKVHAALVRAGDAWQVEDLGSRNGTVFNGAKIAAPTPLKPGDRFRIGLTELEFALPDPQGLRLRGADGVEWPLTGERLVIGRAGGGADLPLPDDKASREHAQLDHDDGGWTIIDRGSRNGTWLNDERLAPERIARLRPGDRLRIGRCELTVAGPAPATATPPPVERPARPARPAERPSSATRPIRRERPATEVMDAQTIARDIGLTGMVLRGVMILAVVLVIVLIVVPALDRHLNGEPPPADSTIRVGARPAPDPAPPKPPRPPPKPAPIPPTVTPGPDAPVVPDEPPAPRPVPAERTAPGPDAAAKPEAPPPTVDARAPVYAPRLVAATYLPAAVTTLEITPKGTIVARGDGYVALYEASCAGGAIEAVEGAMGASTVADEFALRLEHGLWRFAVKDGQPSVQAGAQRWWPVVPGALADAARVVDAWSLPDGLVGLGFGCAGPDSLAARDPRDAAQPLAALARGWAPTLSGPGMLYLIAEPGGTPRAATYVPGADPAHAVDAWGRVYIPRRLADPTDTVGLGGSAGVTALSADLGRVVLALDAGALAAGEAGDEAFTALALRDGVLALGGRTAGRRLAATANALRKQPADGADSGLLVVLRLW